MQVDMTVACHSWQGDLLNELYLTWIARTYVHKNANSI